MRRRKSGRIALCGVMCALAMTLMLGGSVLPFATFCAPAVSGVLLVPVAMECGMRLAWVSYAALSMLSVLFVPDKESAFIFVFLLGHYPLLKAYLQRIPWRWLRAVVKTAVFNGLVFACYGLMLYILPIQAIVQEFAQTAPAALAGLLALANLCFWVYDAALNNLIRAYAVRVRPLLRRFL